MDRKLAATFLLSFCVALLAASLTFAADRPYVPMEDRAVIPVKWAPVYGLGGAEDAGFAHQQSLEKVELGVTATNAIGTAVGTTTYDYQHNGTMGRQVEHRGTEFVHINWMQQLGKTLGEGRRCGYNLIDLLNTCLADPGYDVHTEYGGYVNIDVWGTKSWAIPGVHSGADADHMAPRAYWDYRKPSGTGPSAQFSYEDHPTAVYGGYQEPNWLPNGLGANEHQNLWPIIEFQTGGPDMYLHMVTAESGGAAGSPQTISYYRRTGPYGDDTLPDGSIIATWSGQCVIDTVEDIAPIVTSSQTTGQVCLVWNAPADFRRDQDAEFNGLGVQLCNDIWFARSTDRGSDWVAACEDPATSGTSIQSLIDMGVFTGGVSDEANGAYGVTWNDNGGNITAYGWEYDYKAYTNISGLITSDEFLHVVWNGRRWTDTTSIYRRQSGIFHWSDDPAASGGGTPGVIRTVAKALWDTGGTCYVGAWQSDIDKVGISECDGKLYVVWAQFGNLANPCYDYETEDKFLNGELYLSASDDAGFHWDRGQNLTLTESHNCDCGNAGVGANCSSENYPSIARFGRTAELCEGHGLVPVLDLLYVNDLCAGGVVQDGRGIWTVNDVMWFSTPCREVVPEPAYVDDIGFGIGECYGSNPLVINPNTDTTTSFTIENTGLLANNVNISIRPSIASDWLEVTPTSFSVGTGVDNYQVVDLHFIAPTGAGDPSVYVCTLDIVHDADPKLTTREVPVCLMVASVFATPQWAVVATPTKRVRIWNTGVIGSGGAVPGNEGFDYIDECDTLHPNVNADRYLYAASPVVCRLDGNDTLRFSAYSDNYLSETSLRPLGWATGTRDSVVVDSTTYADFTYSKVEFATADTLIGFWNEFFVPKDPAYADFMVVRMSFWNMLPAIAGQDDTLHDVLIGEFLDWDVPTDFRTDTVAIFNGPNYITGNWSGWEKLDSIDNGGQWEYSGVLWMRGAEVNDSLEGDGSGPDFPYCASSINHATRFAGVIGDPHSPFKNATSLDNPSYVYRAGRTLEPGVIYALMKNNVGFNGAHWEPLSGAEESTYVDLSMLITFGEYDLPPGGMTNPRKYTYTFAILGTPGIDGTESQAYDDFLQMCDDAELWMDNHASYIKRHCVEVPGDANHDGTCNIGDQVTMINHVFKSTPPPVCPAEGDANGDGALNVGDAVYIGNYVFKSSQCPINPPVGCPPAANPPEKK